MSSHHQEGLLAAASFVPRSMQPPNGWCGHLPFAAWLMRVLQPSTFVELGTHSGNSYFAFCQSVREATLATKCYAVDTWLGDEHAGTYGNEVFRQVHLHNDAHYAEFSRLLRMTFDEAVQYFSDGSIELLHIDGLHTYDAVRHDFETWLPRLAPGAVVLFHDTNVRERGFGVWKLWEELQARYPRSVEFPHSHGLGVLQLEGAPDAKQLHWLEAETEARIQLTKYFAALGARQLERFEVDQLQAHVGNLHQAVTERQGRVDVLSQTTAERDAQTAELTHAMAEREAQIATLTQAVAERDGHIARLTRIVADHEEQIACLTEAAAEPDEQVIHLTQTVADRDGRIADLMQAVAGRDLAIHQLRHSTSWRITAPFRGVGYLVYGLRTVPGHWKQHATHAQEVPAAAMAAWRRCGGLSPLLKRTYTILKAEGWSGLNRRLAYFKDRPQHVSVYHDWLRRYDPMTPQRRTQIKARISALVRKPVISVIMPTYNPEPKWLVEAIESVRRQLYPHWELCIADDASTDPRVRPILDQYAAQDARIKVVYRPSNGHISAASNSALEVATGDYLALLDHDDALTDHALFWVVDELSRHPDAKLLYSDEDKIDERGERTDPYFKCEWNPDLFYSHNLITHLGVYRTDVVRGLGGFRLGYEGAQDYDLALRCIERLDPLEIVHIPRVLYHWRIHPGSTAAAGAAKPYALGAGQKAIDEHLQRRGVAAHVEPLPHLGMYRVRYDLPAVPPLVSLIIPIRNGLELIRTCVTSIVKKTTYQNYEILIVDNGSDDPKTLAYLNSLRHDRRIRVLRDDRPFNFSALNNAAVKEAGGEVVGLINNDIEVITPDWLKEMVSHALRPEVGAVGARLLYPNNTLQHGGVILGIAGVAGHAHKGFTPDMHGYFGRAKVIQSFSAVTAACLVIRKDLYVKAGGLDEHLRVAYNDIDFCLRVREMGYRNIYTPYAELYHHESATRGYEDTPEKLARFEREGRIMKKRWGELLRNDPAYSPNLTLEQQDFNFAWPPRVDTGFTG